MLKFKLGVTALALLLGSLITSIATAEGPPNWLADAIKQARSQHAREQRQHRQIRAAIGADSRGKELAVSSNLDSAITAGLAAAVARQKEFDANPKLAAASPAIAASWVIFEKCGVPVPEPQQGQ